MNNQVRRANLTRKHSQSVRISLLAVILPAQPQLSVTLPCQKYWNLSYRPCQSTRKCNILSIIISYYIILHYITLHYITLHYITLHIAFTQQSTGSCGYKAETDKPNFYSTHFSPRLSTPALTLSWYLRWTVNYRYWYT